MQTINKTHFIASRSLSLVSRRSIATVAPFHSQSNSSANTTDKMLLDILAVLCTLKIVFAIPVPVRLADGDSSAAVEEVDFPQLLNSMPPPPLPFHLLHSSLSNIISFTVPPFLFQASNPNISLPTDSSPITDAPGPAIPDMLDIPIEQANTPGPVNPDTLDAQIEQKNSYKDAARAMFAKAGGALVPVHIPDAATEEGTSNEDAVRDLIAKNNATEESNNLMEMLASSTNKKVISDEDAARDLLDKIATSEEVTATTSDGDNLMALLADATNRGEAAKLMGLLNTTKTATSNEDTLMALLANAATSEESHRLTALLANNTTTEQAASNEDALWDLLTNTATSDEATLLSILANTPGPILPRDTPPQPDTATRAPSQDNDALMAFLAHATTNTTSLPPQDDPTASGTVNTTKLLVSSLDTARATGRNPLGRTWEQLLNTTDADGADVPVVLLGMEECEARMKMLGKRVEKSMRRDEEGADDGENGENVGEEEKGLDDKMNEFEIKGEMGNWWCF